MSSGRRIIAAVIVGIFAVSVIRAQEPCTPKRHARIPAIKELTYHRARARLLAAGWTPFVTLVNPGDDNINVASGNGQIFWRKGYREVESCSGTGLAACSFLFNDADGNRLRVTTEGEELVKPRANARVSGFRFVCRDRD